MIQKRIMIIVFSLLVSLSAQAQNIKLAVISEIPDTDIDSPKYLKDILPACQIALEEMKGRLRKAGIRVELDYHPYKYGPLSPFETLKKVTLTADVGAVGFQTSDEVMVAAPAIVGSQFVTVSPYASGSKILKFAPNFLSLTANNREQALLIENFIDNDLQAKRIAAIVAWDSPFSKDFYDSLSENIRKKIKLFKVWDSLAGFEDSIMEITKTNPDVVILPNFPVNAASVIRILSKAGLHPVFVGPDSWGENSDQRFEKIAAGEKFSGYTFRQFSLLNHGPQIDRFAKTLRSHGAAYSVVAGLYHDATLYMLQLIADAPKPVTRIGLLQMVKTHPTITGIMGKNCISSATCAGRQYWLLKATPNGFRLERPYVVPK